MKIILPIGVDVSTLSPRLMKSIPSAWKIVANNSPYFASFKEDVRGQGGVRNQMLMPQLWGQVLRPEKETAGVPEMRDRSRARAAEIAFLAALSLNWRRGSTQLPARFCLLRFFNGP